MTVRHFRSTLEVLYNAGSSEVLRIFWKVKSIVLVAKWFIKKLTEVRTKTSGDRHVAQTDFFVVKLKKKCTQWLPMHFGSTLESFESTLEALWKYFSSALQVLLKYFGSAFEVLWRYFGSTLEVLWKCFTSALEVPWKCFGSAKEVPWKYFGSTWEGLWKYFESTL